MSLNLLQYCLEHLNTEDYKPNTNFENFTIPLLGDRDSLSTIYSYAKSFTFNVELIYENPHIFIKKGEDIIKVYKRFRSSRL